MSKTIDLTGQRFGKLVVLYKVGHTKNGSAIWRCKCDCGNTIDCSSEVLRRGQKTHCGCERKRNANLNLIDKRFGRLIVKEKVYHDKNVFWRCDCDCGRSIDVRGQALTCGATKSCGCLKKEREPGIIGQRFGRLIVLCKNEEKINHYWCLCDCENIVSISYDCLKSGSVQSCGCYKSEKLRELRTGNLLGQRFGNLVVTKFLGYNDKGHAIWEALCDCGNYTTSTTGILNSGYKNSCGCLVSYGELCIRKILDKNDILYQHQYSFEDCRFPDTNRLARFDFFINNSYVLEFDGLQHYQVSSGWNTEEVFLYTQKHDRIKNEYCFFHHIPIIRIPYYRLRSLCLEDLMLETSKYIIQPDNVCMP